jgi:hypothetical protein
MSVVCLVRLSFPCFFSFSFLSVCLLSVLYSCLCIFILSVCLSASLSFSSFVFFSFPLSICLSLSWPVFPLFLLCLSFFLPVYFSLVCPSVPSHKTLFPFNSSTQGVDHIKLFGVNLLKIFLCKLDNCFNLTIIFLCCENI